MAGGPDCAGEGPESPTDETRMAEHSDLSARLRSIDFHGDSKAVHQLRLEAQRTIDKQVSALGDIDSKAIRILRVNVLLIGLILTALSFTSQAEYTNVQSFLNVYTGLGIVSLIISTAFAALTYTASDLEVGVDPDDVALLLESDTTTTEFDEVVTKSYAMWIRFNDRTNIRNTPLITMTVFLVIAAIAYLSLGVYGALVGPIPSTLGVFTHVALVGIGVTTGLPWQIWDACLEIDSIASVIDFLQQRVPKPPNLFRF